MMAMGDSSCVDQAQTNQAGPARLHKVVCDKGFLDGVELWWLEQCGITLVVPAKDKRTIWRWQRMHGPMPR